MKHLLPILLSAAILCLSCSRTEPVTPSGSEVKICAGNGLDVKTHIGDDALSVVWDNNDKLYLWAADAAGKQTLSGQEFKIFAYMGSKAYFTSTLASPMAQGTYTYICTSPQPTSVALQLYTFNNPALQDGSGRGIMTAGPIVGQELMPLSGYIEEKALSLELQQQLHLLQLYFKDPGNLLGGEKLIKASLTFPKTVAGNISVDLSQPDKDSFAAIGENTIEIEPSTPLSATGSGQRNYCFANIFPTKWDDGDIINAKIYTATKVAVCKDVKLKGRLMARGHATPVLLEPQSVSNFCTFTFTLKSNPIGEPIQQITLTAPSGCIWGDSGSNIFKYSAGSDIEVGTSFRIEFEDEKEFRKFAGKTVSVTYDSEHVMLKSSFTVTNSQTACAIPLDLNVPNILYENFSSVGSFSSHDEYTSGSDAFSKSAYSFLNGWTGGRIGASAGKCIRIACRRETSADYDARVDSAPLSCTFKKSTNLNVEFSYGSNNKYGGIVIITDGNVGQTCYVGYVTSSTAYESGDTDGNFESGNSFYTKEYTGSYTNTPNDTYYTIHNIPAGTSPVRITWRTAVEHRAGTTNTTCWLYLDNIKITIAK